jgi:hypothetical protein
MSFPPITYLHRTARDYIESYKVWNALVLRARTTQPEPKTALFMYHLIEVKSKIKPIRLYLKSKALILLSIA